MKKGTLNDPQKVAREMAKFDGSKIGNWGNGDYEVKTKKQTDIGYVLSLIRESHDKD